MANSGHYRKLEAMMHSAPFIELIGLTAVVKKGQAEMILPVKEEFFHAAGAIRSPRYLVCYHRVCKP